jgi:DNA-binding NarL/FixJ family response regulator
VKVLLVSEDPSVRESMELVVRSVERALGEPFEFIDARNGKEGIALAWRHRPQVVVADEITSPAGAFALAKDLKDADPPFAGSVVILLDRSQDAWLARWSGADAWFVKPVNPFELAETVARFLGVSREEAV